MYLVSGPNVVIIIEEQNFINEEERPSGRRVDILPLWP